MDHELIVLVDDNGDKIGEAPKLSSHNGSTPLHLGFSAYVFNKKGEFLLTRRSLKKKTWPGVWTNSCCGHPAPGEKTEDAVRRRLKFELNLTAGDVRIILPNFRYRAEMNGIVEREICPVFTAYVNQHPKPNPDEVEDWRWVKWEDFLEDINKNSAKYSYWCLKQAEELKTSFTSLNR